MVLFLFYGLFGLTNFQYMLKNLLKNKKTVVFSIIILFLIVAIRLFEDKLFYDPFLKYFEKQFTHLAFPEINTVKLFLSLGFRYYLNSILSIALLYVLFKDIKIIKFSTLLYLILGSVLMIAFFFVLHFFGEENKMTLFYIRRFIIQPIFLVLFIPAFFYQKKVK
jgi:exosortase F-associated protein